MLWYVNMRCTNHAVHVQQHYCLWQRRDCNAPKIHEWLEWKFMITWQLDIETNYLNRETVFCITLTDAVHWQHRKGRTHLTQTISPISNEFAAKRHWNARREKRDFERINKYMIIICLFHAHNLMGFGFLFVNSRLDVCIIIIILLLYKSIKSQWVYVSAMCDARSKRTRCIPIFFFLIFHVRDATFSVDCVDSISWSVSASNNVFASLDALCS